MDKLELMLAGQMDMRNYISCLKSDIGLQTAISNLVPVEAKIDPSHPLWKHISYSALQKYDFDLYKLLLALTRFDGTISDNLNIFASIKAVYAYLRPEFDFTSKYSDAHLLYLHIIRDCFDGPEVRHITEKIIQDALEFNTKKQRLSYGRAEIASVFHVIDKRYPRWIQGPEWPMGINSPMIFLSKKRKGEEVHFLFEDYDSGERRTVVQFF